MGHALDSRRGLAVVLAAVLAAIPSRSAAAEFKEGVAAHSAGDFARARVVFMDLAALADGPSQYNLGAMALRGEGAPADRGAAAGWMISARQNAHDPTPRAVDDLVAKLAPAEREATDRIVAQYGRAALEERVLPRDAFASARPPPSPSIVPPRLVSGPTPQYPNNVLSEGKQAIVLVRSVLGEDGHPRDAQVVLSIPSVSEGGRPFVDSAFHALLARRYEPARLDGRPIAVSYNVRLAFQLRGSDGILKPDMILAARAAAADGDPRAQFLAGVVGIATRPRPAAAGAPWLDRSAEERQILAAAQAGVAEAQLFVGRRALRSSPAAERAKALPWLERAFASGVAGARASYGLALLLSGEPDLVRARPLLDHAAATDDVPNARRAVTLLACSEDAGLRAPDLALAIARRLSVDDPDPLTAEAIAAARASSGDFRGAADAERDALKRAKKLGWNVTAMQARLDGYAAEKQCRGDFLPAAVEGR